VSKFCPDCLLPLRPVNECICDEDETQDGAADAPPGES